MICTQHVIAYLRSCSPLWQEGPSPEYLFVVETNDEQPKEIGNETVVDLHASPFFINMSLFDEVSTIAEEIPMR